MDFTKDVHSVQILNKDDEESTISPDEVLLHNSDPNPERFIVSDADEELIILVKFKQSVDLKSFKIYALPLDDDSNIDEASAPKQIHIYKLSHLNQDFEDIKGLKPHKSLICSTKKLSKGQNVNLRKNISKPLVFAKVKFMAIFIESNQGDTDKTYLHGLAFNEESNATEQSPSTVRDLAVCYCRGKLEQRVNTCGEDIWCSSCFRAIKPFVGFHYFCAKERQCCYHETTLSAYVVCGQCLRDPVAHRNLSDGANNQQFVSKKAEAELTKIR